MLTANELRQFEQQVAEEFAAAKIHSPVHFCGGNEEPLIEIFSRAPKDAWVFSTWRSHYHALLHGVPQELVLQEIRNGHSMNLNFPQYKFFSSAIVGGTLPIACGVAASGQRVYCFVGDMTASIGTYYDAIHYIQGHNLPVTIVVEDNGLATNTPTELTWGKNYITEDERWGIERYYYDRIYPHVGLEQRVQF